MTVGAIPHTQIGWADVNTQGTVLVGIVTRNRATVLPKAIESALSQTYPQLRVAVLDDGSEDDTPQLRARYPEVQWARWERSRGYLEARNHLMRGTDADFYLSLDDDAWFIDGDEISLAVRHMELNPMVAAIAFDILSPDRPHRKARMEPHRVALFIGCGHLVRIAALRDCGFYEPSPGLYGSEEKDLCLRLLERGWKVHLLPGVHVWHDKTELARNQAAQHRSGVCNDLTFTLRRCPLTLLPLVLPTKMFQHLRFAVGHGLLRPCLAGFRLFLQHAWESWKGRSPVRAETFVEFIRRSRAIL